MKKLMTFVAAGLLGISLVGCAEKKPAPPATPPAEAKPEPAPTTTEPAPAATEEKK